MIYQSHSERFPINLFPLSLTTRFRDTCLGLTDTAKATTVRHDECSAGLLEERNLSREVTREETVDWFVYTVRTVSGIEYRLGVVVFRV